MNNTSWWKNKCHQTWNSIQCAPIVHHGESDVFPFWRISTILDTWTFPLYFIQWGDCWTSPTIFLRAYSSKISQTKENVMNDHGLVTCHHFKCETPPNTCLWISFFFYFGLIFWNVYQGAILLDGTRKWFCIQIRCIRFNYITCLNQEHIGRVQIQPNRDKKIR